MTDHDIAAEAFDIPSHWEGDLLEKPATRTQSRLGVRVIVDDDASRHRLAYESAIVVGDGDVTIVFDRVQIASHEGAAPWRELQRVVIHPRVAERVKDDWLEHRLREVVDHHLGGGSFFFRERYY